MLSGLRSSRTGRGRSIANASNGRRARVEGSPFRKNRSSRHSRHSIASAKWPSLPYADEWLRSRLADYKLQETSCLRSGLPKRSSVIDDPYIRVPTVIVRPKSQVRPVTAAKASFLLEV